MSHYQVNLKINNIPVTVDEGTTILEAARKLNFRIPTLCHHPDLSLLGNCRVCVVEVKGNNSLAASCAAPVSEGMEVFTNSARVRQSRKHIVELLLSEHNSNCTKCYKNGNCELQELAHEYRYSNLLFADVVRPESRIPDMSSPSIVKDDSKCIRCQRCVRTCDELQGIGALTVVNKGEHQRISTFYNHPLHEVVCTNCGQCVNRCPTGALVERNYIEEVWNAIYDPTKFVVVQTAPATRVALGEDLGKQTGERVTGKMVSALRKLGFNKVLDTDFTADLTIIEEGNELLNRLKRNIKDGDPDAPLPVMTSCSPGWVKFQEHIFADMLPNLSTCKSPQQMFGALAKTYYAERINIKAQDMVVVSIMPCTAKKFECERPEMRDSGFQDVDYVLTTRELAQMIKQAGIAFDELEEGEYDSILGESTGAGVIFGATGGVMEAALRTAYEIITGREIPFVNLNVDPVRGMDGIKTASIKLENLKEEWNFLEGVDLKVAVAHGLRNAHELMDRIRDGEVYHFVEVMGCPGGCLGGGGQPIPTDISIRKKRAEAIYAEDAEKPLRKSHDNPEVQSLYEHFLGEPLGHKSHELLHTHYRERHRL